MLAKILKHKFNNILLIGKLRFSTKLNIKGLPFNVTLEMANKIITENKDFFEQSDENIKNSIVVSEKSPLSLIYVPVQSIDVRNIETIIVNGSYEIDEYYYVPTFVNGKITMQRQVKVHKYFVNDIPLEIGSYPFGNKYSLQKYAGFTFPITYINDICKISDNVIKDLKYLTEDDLIDESDKTQKKYKWIEPPSTSIGFILSELLENLNDLEKNRAKNHLKKHYRGDRHYINSINYDISKCSIKFETTYVPIIVYEYKASNMKFYKFINGYNGKIIGDIIKDSNKITISSFIASYIGISSLGLLFSRFAFVHPITFSISIAITLFMRYLSKRNHIDDSIKNKQNNKKINDENEQFEKTTEDMQRFEQINNFNKQNDNINPFESEFLFDNATNDWISSNNEFDKYYFLLGLNSKSNNKYTINDVKNAYHIKIKLYHPDTYKNDKSFAIEMTKAINEAYEKITTNIKQNRQL